MKRTSKNLILALFLLLLTVFSWQPKSSAQSDENNLTATTSFKSDEAIVPATAIEISFNRNLNSC